MAAKLTKVTKKEAIRIMEQNLKAIKECSEKDTFLLLSYDFDNDKSYKRRMNRTNGMNLINRSKTFVLNDDKDIDAISVLSMYSTVQKDIRNIIPVGKQHNMLIFPNVE